MQARAAPRTAPKQPTAWSEELQHQTEANVNPAAFPDSALFTEKDHLNEQQHLSVEFLPTAQMFPDWFIDKFIVGRGYREAVGRGGGSSVRLWGLAGSSFTCLPSFQSLHPVSTHPFAKPAF